MDLSCCNLSFTFYVDLNIRDCVISEHLNYLSMLVTLVEISRVSGFLTPAPIIPYFFET